MIPTSGGGGGVFILGRYHEFNVTDRPPLEKMGDPKVIYGWPLTLITLSLSDARFPLDLLLAFSEYLSAAGLAFHILGSFSLLYDESHPISCYFNNQFFLIYNVKYLKFSI